MTVKPKPTPAGPPELVGAASRIILGAALFAAGFQKIGSLEQFAKVISNYQLLPESLTTLAALFVPWLEIVVGACLLLGCLCSASALLAVLLTSGFGVFVGSALARGLNIECGCFSGASKVSWLHLGLDLLLLGLAVKVLWGGPDRWSLDARWSPTRSSAPGRKAMVVGGLLLLFNFAYFAIAANRTDEAALAAQPTVALSLDPPSLNLGLLSQGTEVERTVAYRNSSANTIEIVDITSSCGCTVPIPSKTVLAPGESSEMSVKYNPKASRGPIRQTVNIFLKGHSEPIPLQVSAVVDTVIEVVPGVLELEVGQAKRFRLETKKSGLTFHVLSVQAPDGLSVRQLTSNPGSVELEALLSAPLPPLQGASTVWTVAILTDVPNLPPAILYLRKPLSE